MIKMGAAEGQILLWIQEYLRCDILTGFFKFITGLGDNGIIWIILTVVLLIVKKYRKAGLMSAAALLCSLIINNLLLKNIVARTRPYEVIAGLQRLLPAQVDYSFPSGHTGSSFAAAVIFYMYLPKKYGIPAMVLAVLIGFSRLYLGVHYVSDVLGGAFIGIIIAFCIRRVDELRQKGKA